MLLGSFAVGIVSDKLGRKPTLMICIILLWIAGIINAFTTSLALYGICRLIIGMCSIGEFICAYVIVAESTLPSYTNRLTKALSTSFPFGNLVLGLTAYYFREVRDLQLMLFAPIIVTLIPLYFVRESTRWLIAKGRYREARENIKFMARQSGRVAPDAIDTVVNNETTKADEVAKATFVDLFRPRKMLFRTLSCFFEWFCVTGTFYALAFGSTALSGNPYVNFSITALTGFPALMIGLYTYDRVGRKWSLVICQAMSGVCCVIIGFVIGNEDLKVFQIVVVFFGKLCAGITFGLVYLYCAEMYPTKLRATALGTCSTFGRVGGIYALSLDGLRQFWDPLPFVLIGGQAILAGLLALTFPETTGCKLPETTDEALNNVGKNYKRLPWCGSTTSTTT